MTSSHRRFALLLLWTLLAVPPVPASEPVTAPAAAAPSVAAEDLLPNGRQPLPGLLTGGQPTPDQIAAIAAAGYETVIDLRPEGENGAPADHAEQVAALGLRYVRIPVAGAGDLTDENARELDRALEAAVGPTVVHCASGNRVGALLALRAHLDGATPEAALEHGRDAGLTGLEPAVRERLGLPPAEPVS